MARQQIARNPVTDLFREVVLVLGGAFAARGTDDETVRQVARGLERVYLRARERTVPAARAAAAPVPHPAITALLQLTEEARR